MAYWIPAYLNGMKPYLDNPDVGGMYGMWNAPDAADVNGPFGPGVPGEGGVDLDSPQGTPVFALADGPIVGIGYWKDQQHGVVTTRINVPGHGQNDVYYQHITFDGKLKQGQNVKRGQQIGVVGGLNEVEIGFNANWGQPWGTSHPAGWVKDPRPLIEALMAQGDPSSSGAQVTVQDFMDSVVDNLAGYNGSLGNIITGHTAADPDIYNFMVAWAQQEGGGITNSATFNPLNTKQAANGSKDAGHGIQAYPDAKTGIQATMDALKSGLYGALVNAITTNDTLNLGFIQRPDGTHSMASNVASELMIWDFGKADLRNPTDEAYPLKIMALAGIQGASIQGGNIDSGQHAQSQEAITAYGNKVLGPDTNGLTVAPGSLPNPLGGLDLSGINNFFSALQGFFSNPVRLIKIVGGAAMIIVGLVLLARSLVPSVSIGGKA